MNDENDQNGAAAGEALEPPADEGSAPPITSEDVKIGEPPAPIQWQMPEPVFRKSSGYLPQGFEKRYPVAQTSPAEAASAEAAMEPPVEGPEVSGPDIQPQPDISQEYVLDEFVAEEPPVKERSRFVTVLLSVLGILAMVVFALGFLALVYYLFFYHPNESQNLN